MESIMTDQELGTTIEKYFKFLNTDKPSPVTLYLNSLAPSGQRSMRSLLQTAANIFEFEGQIERMPWPLLQYHHFAQVISTLKANGKATNTINLTIAACKGVMKACFNLGLIKAEQLMQINEVKRVRGKKLPSGRSLTQQEIRLLIATCKRDKTIIGKRDLAIIALMLATGLRRSEVINLNIADYNTRNGELVVMAGKGNKQRIAYIQKAPRQLIRLWLNCRGMDEGTIFYSINNNQALNKKMTSQSVYDMLKKRSTQAKINHCSPHDLRRTFVTKLLESGVDLNTVRQLAGHSDIQTTARYDLRDTKEQKKIMKQTIFLV